MGESSSGTRTRASYTPRYTYSSDSYTSSSSSSDSGAGLSAGAIRGIAIGVSLGVCLVFILLAIFIVKRRRANRMKRAAQPNLPPAYSPGAPMQQQPPPPSNPAYQPVAQQDPSYQGGYFAPEAVGKNNGNFSHDPTLGFTVRLADSSATSQRRALFLPFLQTSAIKAGNLSTEVLSHRPLQKSTEVVVQCQRRTAYKDQRARTKAW